MNASGVKSAHKSTLLLVSCALRQFLEAKRTPTELFAQSKMLRVKYYDGLMACKRMSVARERQKSQNQFSILRLR